MKIELLSVFVLAVFMISSIAVYAVGNTTTLSSGPIDGGKVCPAVCVPLYELQNGCKLNECGSGCGADNINTFTSEVDCKNRIGRAESGTVGAPTGSIILNGTINGTIIHIIPGEGCTGDRCPLSEARTAPVLKGVLETPDVSVEYEGELAVSGSKIFMKTSAGQKQINVMPEDAARVSDIPLSAIKKIELKEKNQKPVYSVIGVKQAKLFFIIPTSMEINTEVDAVTGSIIYVNKPWWSFLAAIEPAQATLSGVQPTEYEFAIYYSFGVGEKNIFDMADTSSGIDVIYMKDVECGKPAAKYKMNLTQNDVKEMRDFVIENDLFNIDADFTKNCDSKGICSYVTPLSTSTLKITMDEKTKVIKWSAAYSGDDKESLKIFENVEKLIRGIISDKEKEMNIPEQRCGYQ